MAFSPSRRTYSNYPQKRQLYSHQGGRQQNFNAANLTAKSPSIRSPKLNQQSQYTKLKDAHDFQQIKIKLETVLKHNSQLLNENATLSQMVNNQRIQFEAKFQKDEVEIIKARKQMEMMLEQLKEQQKMQEVQIGRLLDQISRLHEQKYRLEVDKNNQMKGIQQKYEKDMTTQIRNMKKSSEDSKQIYQLQIRKFKESVELKNYQIQSLKAQAKNQVDKLKGEVEELKNQLKHVHQIQEYELKQLKQNHREFMINKTKQLERQNQLNTSKLQGKVRKLKQDLINKNVEIQQAHRKGVQSQEDKQQQIINLKQERQRLIDEINQLEVSVKQNFQREKQKIIQISQMEKNNIEALALNQKQCLKAQISKLNIICNNKSQEIRRLYRNNTELKQSFQTEKNQLLDLVSNLKKRIKKIEDSSLEEIELLKIKMTQLHEADISNLQKYYESELILLTQQNKALLTENEANRQKIHKLLQDNDALRKTFEIELAKYKAKVQDYKVKFAAANLQFRQQITSLGTKMSLTSQTLLREAQQKKKGAQFFENQKKKFHNLIQNKDKQIQTAYQTMNRLKELHSSELKQQQTEIRVLKETIDQKIRQLENVQRYYQQQFEQKSKKLIEQQQDPDERLHKQNKQLRDKLEEAEKQIYQKLKEIQFSQKQIKSLQQQVGLRAGFLQTMQLESSAAIQDERSKMKILMNQAEVAMKDYYEAKINSREKDNQNLREQLIQKQADIRQLIVKYNQLENRMKQMMQAQSKLTLMQQKVMQLGMDQNLIKNIGQLFSKYKQEQE